MSTQNIEIRRIPDTDARGNPFILFLRTQGGSLVNVSLERPGTALADGQTVGPVFMSFRVLCWGEIFHRLKHGIAIPQNWYAHGERSHE